MTQGFWSSCFWTWALGLCSLCYHLWFKGCLWSNSGLYAQQKDTPPTKLHSELLYVISLTHPVSFLLSSYDCCTSFLSYPGGPSSSPNAQRSSGGRIWSGMLQTLDIWRWRKLFCHWEVVKVISLRHSWTPKSGCRKYFLPWLLSAFYLLTWVSKTCQSILFQTLGHGASWFQLESSFEHPSLAPSLISVSQHPRNIISSLS